MYRVDVYLRVRRAVMVDGMSMREAARTFGLHRDTVRKMLAYSVPPGYRRQTPPRRPKLEPYTGVIDRILEDDLRRPRKQRHTAKRIFWYVLSTPLTSWSDEGFCFQCPVDGYDPSDDSLWAARCRWNR